MSDWQTSFIGCGEYINTQPPNQLILAIQLSVLLNHQKAIAADPLCDWQKKTPKDSKSVERELSAECGSDLAITYFLTR